MSAKPSRSLLLVLLPLILILGVLMLGCMPCCCWPNGLKDLNDLKDLDTGGGATVSGTAYITSNDGETPVPGIDVSMTTDNSSTAKYRTTTDTDGYFLFNNVTPGTYFIRIAGGDLGWTDTITVQKGLSLTLGDIQLHPTLPPPPKKSKNY